MSHKNINSPANPIREIFETRSNIISVEMRANTFTQFRAMIQSAKKLAKMGVDLFDVPDNAGASVNIGTIGTSLRLQEATRIPTIIHWTTRQRNLLSIQSHLLEASILGIQGVLALSGDHPSIGQYPEAKVVNDLRGSVQLMELLEKLNNGELSNGMNIGGKCDFYVGGGFNIAKNLKPHLKHLKRKIDKGAKFAFTQPVYTIDQAQNLCQDLDRLPIKVLYGIMPIISLRSVGFMRDRLGIHIPQSIVDKLAEADPTQVRDFGTKMTLEFALRLREQQKNLPIDGIYIIPPATINWANKRKIIANIIRNYRPN